MVLFPDFFCIARGIQFRIKGDKRMKRFVLKNFLLDVGRDLKFVMISR